jgi:hypothetical protein
MPEQIIKDRAVEALKAAAGWPGADRATIVRAGPGSRHRWAGPPPNAGQLAQLRQQALYRLMERHQLQDPFRFLVYAEMAGVEIGPVA